MAAMNLFALLDQAAVRFPRQGAVYSGDDPVCDYAELRVRALRLSASLRRRHNAGDRVAIITENRPQYVELLFGIWGAGLVAVPVNAKLHPREAAHILDDCTASACFVSPSLADALVPELRNTAAAACAVIAFETDAYAEASSEAPAEPVDVAPDALAWLFYTSGTTGRSKGAMLSHRNLLAMTIAYLADIGAAWIRLACSSTVSMSAR